MKHSRLLIAAVALLLLAGIAGSLWMIRPQDRMQVETVQNGAVLRITNTEPIPGIKLGLANIITVYALYHYRAGKVLMVLLIRIFLGRCLPGA